MTIDPRGRSAICPRFDIACRGQGGFNCFEGGITTAFTSTGGYITDGREGHRRFSVLFLFDGNRNSDRIRETSGSQQPWGYALCAVVRSARSCGNRRSYRRCDGEPSHLPRPNPLDFTEPPASSSPMVTRQA
jgi:hypothetical protein